MNEKLYIPSNALYSLIHAENEYDIIVVGCEPEGVTAAVSAARMGAKVLLIGQETTPGGLLVHGMLIYWTLYVDKEYLVCYNDKKASFLKLFFMK